VSDIKNGLPCQKTFLLLNINYKAEPAVRSEYIPFTGDMTRYRSVNLKVYFSDKTSWREFRNSGSDKGNDKM